MRCEEGSWRKIREALLERGMREEVSEAQLKMRKANVKWGLPRHPQKSVEGRLTAQVLGSRLDGEVEPQKSEATSWPSWSV